MKNLTIKINEELLLDFRLKCKKTGISQVSIIRKAIIDYIEKIDDYYYQKQLDEMLKLIDEIDLEN